MNPPGWVYRLVVAYHHRPNRSASVNGKEARPRVAARYKRPTPTREASVKGKDYPRQSDSRNSRRCGIRCPSGETYHAAPSGLSPTAAARRKCCDDSTWVRSPHTDTNKSTVSTLNILMNTSTHTNFGRAQCTRSREKHNCIVGEENTRVGIGEKFQNSKRDVTIFG